MVDDVYTLEECEMNVLLLQRMQLLSILAECLYAEIDNEKTLENV